MQMNGDMQTQSGISGGLHDYQQTAQKALAQHQPILLRDLIDVQRQLLNIMAQVDELMRRISR